MRKLVAFIVAFVAFPTSAYATSLHYAANGNFSNSGTYEPGAVGFNLADVGSASEAKSLPTGVKGLVWVGKCDGVTTSFRLAVKTNRKVWGFYVMDEPYVSSCSPKHLRAESDYIHHQDLGDKTFIILVNMSATKHPRYTKTYTPRNSHINYFGLDPYPCRTEIVNCRYSWIGRAVTAAVNAGIPRARLIPVYQAFGGGNYTDDGGGKYRMPTAAETTQILQEWRSVLPRPVFDYAYSWGQQENDSSLSAVPADQTIYQQWFASE
jgi:hypothetical protein